MSRNSCEMFILQSHIFLGSAYPYLKACITRRRVSLVCHGAAS